VGTNLYYTILQFFEARMREHSAVDSFERLQVEDEIIYVLTRRKHQGTIKVWLADQYHFTDMDYYGRPNELKAGDYILIARPECGENVDRELIRVAKIGVGKLVEFMGALNKREMWKYVPPTEEEKRDKQRRFRS
jgi:hypothetical protein